MRLPTPFRTLAACVLVLCFLAAGCGSGSDRGPAGEASPAAAQTAQEPQAETSRRAVSGLRVVSMVSASAPASGERSWRLEPGRESFDLDVTLEGTGSVVVRITLTDETDGHVVHNDEQAHELDGQRMDLRFADVGPVRRAGSDYTLALEITGPGITQSQSVRVRRS